MDFTERSGVNVAHCVYVTGATNTQADDEVIDYLRTYGDLKMAFSVTDMNSSFYKTLIVEYNSSAALNKLKPLLPYTFKSQSDAHFICQIKLLADEFHATATGGSAATTPAPTVPSTDYLHELKQTAQRSGKSVEEVMKEMMDQISEHLAEAGDDDDDDNEDPEEEREETTTEILETARHGRSTTCTSIAPIFPAARSFFHWPAGSLSFSTQCCSC